VELVSARFSQRSVAAALGARKVRPYLADRQRLPDQSSGMNR